jgi:hypothetical protein
MVALVEIGKTVFSGLGVAGPDSNYRLLAALIIIVHAPDPLGDAVYAEGFPPNAAGIDKMRVDLAGRDG